MTDRSLTDVLDDLRFAMVATPDADGTWRARPLTMADSDADADRVSFLVSAQAEWVPPLEASGAPATATFSDPSANTYVALHGRATVVDDRARIEAMWNVGAASYFEGADDPQVRVLDVTVDHGEYWDSPSGRLGSLLSLAAAAMGREIGEQGDVDV